MIGLVRTRPAMGTPVERGARRVVLNRFPYNIVYQEGGEIVIVAVAHQRRDDTYWHDRIENP